MSGSPLLLELIGDIYEASYQPAYWPVVIEKITRLTNSKSGALFIQDQAIQEAAGFYPAGLPLSAIEDYARFGSLDPAFPIMQHKAVGESANIYGPPRHQLESPEYYENIRQKYDIGYVGGANVLADEGQVVGLGLHRSAASSAYDEDTLGLISDLIPHLQRALRIHREFIRLRVEKTAMTAGFDRLMMGLVLFDHLGTPIYSNPVAESILDEHPAIAKVNNRLIPTQHEDAVKLHRLIISCLEPVEGSQGERGGVMGLHHEERAHPLAVMVKPVAASELKNIIDGEPVYAAMYLSDPDRPLPIAAATVAELYGLSRAEAHTAIALVNGLSVEEIAESEHKSVHTVRSHLKSIFNKTHTSKQSELVRLLLLGGIV